MSDTIEYTGSTYIGVVGSDLEYGEARDSIDAITRRPGDAAPVYTRATKGYEARQTHIERFLKSHHSFILLLDADMVFHPYTLERLRSHKLPYVSGFYMRRNATTLAPVWYRKFEGLWPMEPWVGVPETDQLYELGASGWGCILLHRDVVLAVREILKGELDVLEDDMDIWPYNLARFVDAVNGLQALVNERHLHHVTVQAYLDVIKDEIKPLRSDREQVGSDIRYPFFAAAAGYQLMGDAYVQPGHVIHYPLNYNDYKAVPSERLETGAIKQREYIESERQRLLDKAVRYD